jgi:CDP-paratose 2-epimerase
LLYAKNPTPAAVYNMGGRGLECSMMEAIKEFEKRFNRDAVTEYIDKPRSGDHIWYCSDVRKAQRELGWKPRRALESIFDELATAAGW